MAPSDDLLRRLARVNPTKAFLVALVVMFLGLFLPGIVGAALLFLLGVGLLLLTRTTWSVQTPATRTVRVILLIVLFAAAITKAL